MALWAATVNENSIFVLRAFGKRSKTDVRSEVFSGPPLGPTVTDSSWML